MSEKRSARLRRRKKLKKQLNSLTGYESEDTQAGKAREGVCGDM